MKTSDTIIYYLQLWALKAVALMPFWLLYLFSDIIRFVLERVLKYRRRIIDENLASSFPDKSQNELAQIKSEFYAHLSDLIVETIKLLHISDKSLDRRIEVVNAGLVDEIEAEGKSSILFLAHYCNWEWVPDVARFYTPEMHSYHVYKKMHSVVSDRLFLKIRSRFASVGIPQHDVVREVLRMHSEGEHFQIGFISDHRSNGKQSHHYVDFLNHHTPINDVGEALGRRCGSRFVYLDVSKPRRGHYRMEFKEIRPDDPTAPMAYTKSYFDMLQQTIRRQPAYWLWSHRRWLYK